MTGAGSWIAVPRWYQALTTEWLPPRFREEFEMAFGAAEQRSAQKAHAWLPRLYAKLPASVRYVGPYQEAQARLRNRTPGFIARRSNMFWIGQARMPFGE
jgi:uncharacterized protein (DUF2236 family)